MCAALAQDIKVLDCIQRWAAKLATGLEGMSYVARLRTLTLPTLAQKMLRDDLTVLGNSMRRGSREGGAGILFLGT